MYSVLLHKSIAAGEFLTLVLLAQGAILELADEAYGKCLEGG